MAREAHRLRFQDELRQLEDQALGALDLVITALDPIATGKIEDLMHELAREYTIVIVTHNMQQAARVSHRTAFFTAEVDEASVRHGRLVEYNDTAKIFTSPAEKRTEDYITGRFG